MAHDSVTIPVFEWSTRRGKMSVGMCGCNYSGTRAQHRDHHGGVPGFVGWGTVLEYQFRYCGGEYLGLGI